MTNVLDIAQKLIRFPSVTPQDCGAQSYLKDLLAAAGYEVYDLPFGAGTNDDPRIENFFARIGTGSPHICFAGHTDVVPTGPEEQWSHPPFGAEIHDGVLYGRGASDMKGGVAAFVAAALAHGAPEKGSISFLITGDEEGPALNGTIKVLEWMEENGHIPDVALVGEPTNPDHLGQEVKIGRRGSLSGYITVNGKQGHVAYQHLAHNPVPDMVKLLDVLASHTFDEGSDHFVPTNLEITTVDVGNTATNVIPQSARATFNVRFNDHWSKTTLIDEIRIMLHETGIAHEITFEGNAESFITKPGEWSAIVTQAVEEITEKKPKMTTTGGTSDARFIAPYCPVIECGGVNKSIHQIDENTSVQVLEDITRIYGRILELYLK